MKSYILLFSTVFGLLSLTCVAQEQSFQITNAAIGTRIPVVKASINLSEWHEPIFWPLYEQYVKRQQKAFQCNSTVLNTLGSTRDIDDSESETCADALLKRYSMELELRKDYFEQITKSTNGIVGLQFLQTEELFDLMIKADLYDQTTSAKNLKKIQQVTSQRNEAEKRKLLAATLDLVDDKDEAAFWRLYNLYAFENSRIVGDKFYWYSIYLDDVSDLTPAQAKQLAEEFIALQGNEIKLKEKYFREINKTIGTHLAARFLIMDDYLSVMGKLEAFQIH